MQAYDSKGEKIWDCELDIYGKVRNIAGGKCFVPFRYQGQYEDEETGLYYNRFRYYSPESGTYISQDPIGLAGNNPNTYAYVRDTNCWIDPVGLSSVPTFDVLKDMVQNTLDFSTAKDGAVFWSGNNMSVAQKWASNVGKTTLEQTKGGKYLDGLKLFSKDSSLSAKQASEIWDIASERFAKNASGDVNVFSHYARKVNRWGSTRVWWRIEKPLLLQNKNVLSITKRRADGSKAKYGNIIKCL